MKTNLIIYITILLLCNSCFFFDAITPDECPDIEYGQLSETAKEYVPYQVGDSVFFKDKSTNEIHYLTCTVRELRKDSFFYPDEHCENEGYYDKWEELNVELLSDIPFYENTYAKINIRIDSKNNFVIDIESIDRITFKETENHFIGFSLFFDINEEKLYIPSDMFSYYKINYKDTLNINYKIYQNIAVINTEIKYYYDTIYYNKNGILKLISSEYNYNLEILE